ncbi:DUF6985 domain-containing protein [Shinella zoogloeoides]|uniref:DUF6985 domain-containing protein n=1 Tax=Shinella zoogloeoides TaxID=352475 RepID=UPI0028AF9A67|nr:hypothetical protein [Shinella zoogloeoides]
MTTLVVPYFGGREVELDDDGDPADPRSAAALAVFLALTEADRISDSAHVFAFCSDYCEEAGRPEWLDEIMEVPENPTNIWDHVMSGPVMVRKGRGDDNNWYVVMEAECAWDTEHGLMLVWHQGKTLTKVGGYNGHLTDAGAYRDADLRNVVYKARNPQFTTRLATEAMQESTGHAPSLEPKAFPGGLRELL